MKVKLGKFYDRAERRIDIQIEQHDTWNLDSTLALIILPALIQLKHTKHGVPSEFVDDIAENWNSQGVFDFMKEDKVEVFEKGCAAWETVLDKIIWSFQQLVIEDYDSKYHHGKIDISWEKTDKQHPDPVTGKMESTYQIIDKNPSEHWYDSVGHRLHEDRIQEGLVLFGRYFRSLWD